jgi:hypothetical protein
MTLSPTAALAASWPDDRAKTLPCRPTVSCTADIAAPGTLEIESGGFFSRNEAGDRVLSFPFLLKQTFTPLLQLQVGSNGYTVARGGSPANYFDNVFVGPKLHLKDQADFWPSLAITAQLSAPTVAASGYARYYNAFLTGHASKDLGPVHVDVNGGANVWRIDDSSAAQGFAVLALSTSIVGPIGGALETYYFTNAPAVPRDGGVRGALNATLRRWLVLDLGGDVGFFSETRAFSLLLGMTIVPVVFWSTER